MFPKKTLSSFVPQFPIGPQDAPSSGFPQQPLAHLMLFPLRPTLPGAAHVFVLPLPHENLLPQPTPHCIKFRLTCFAVIQGPLENFSPCPGQVTQLVGASSHIPKGCRFDFRSGHQSRLRVGLIPSRGMYERQPIDRCFSFTSIFLSLPPPFATLSKINKHIPGY